MAGSTDDTSGDVQPPLTAIEQWLIDQAAQCFVSTSTWPPLAGLKRKAAREGFELPAMTHVFGRDDFLWRPDSAEDTVVLSVAGLAHSDHAVTLVGNFVRVARLCADLYLSEGDDTPQLTSSALRNSLALDDSTIEQVRLLLRTEYFLAAGGGATSPVDWYYEIHELAAKFRAVDTINDYLAIRAALSRPPGSPAPVDPLSPQPTYDFFISHASEDKDSIARPLYNELVERGYSVWFDEATLRMGDSLTRGIDAGLSKCNHGVVIVSPAFCRKRWTEYELQGLVQRAMAGDERVILPVWHGISAAEVRGYSPTLSDWRASDASLGAAHVADEVQEAVGHTPQRPPGNLAVPRTDLERLDLVGRKPGGWEYALYAGVLAQGREARERQWQDHLIGYVTAAGARLGAQEANQAIRSVPGRYQPIVQNLERLFEPALVTKAFGLPGDPGDEQLIVYLGERLIDIYADLLRISNEVRSWQVPDRYTGLQESVALMATRPCEEIREFVDRCVTFVEQDIPNALADSSATPREFVLSLKLTMDETVRARFSEELQKLSNNG